jgi:hypothetical protein
MVYAGWSVIETVVATRFASKIISRGATVTDVDFLSENFINSCTSLC